MHICRTMVTRTKVLGIGFPSTGQAASLDQVTGVKTMYLIWKPYGQKEGKPLFPESGAIPGKWANKTGAHHKCLSAHHKK